MLNRSVTIGRQYASGGREIGKLLSQKLDMPYYDYELVLLAAEKYGLKDGDIVDIQTEGERSVTLHNVLVRAGVKHADEVHIDTDEANACNLGSGVMVNVVTK